MHTHTERLTQMTILSIQWSCQLIAGGAEDSLQEYVGMADNEADERVPVITPEKEMIQSGNIVALNGSLFAPDPSTKILFLAHHF